MKFLAPLSFAACSLLIGLNASAITLTVDNRTDFKIDLKSEVINEAPLVNLSVHGLINIHMPDLNHDQPQPKPVLNDDTSEDPHEEPVLEEQFMTLDIQLEGDLGIFYTHMAPIASIHNDRFNEHTPLTNQSFSNAPNSIYYCHASEDGNGIIIEYSDLYWLKHS